MHFFLLEVHFFCCCLTICYDKKAFKLLNQAPSLVFKDKNLILNKNRISNRESSVIYLFFE